MKKVLSLSGIFFILTVLFSCAPKSLLKEKPTLPEALSAGPQSPAKESWDVEWEKTLALARKEGKVTLLTVFYTSPDTRTALAQGFKKLTGITLEVTAVSPSESAQKLLAERKAGLYISDLYM